MRKKITYALLLLCYSSTYSQILDLNLCLKMADTSNHLLKIARLDIAINQNQIEAYKSSLLPKLGFTADYKYNAIIPGQVVPAFFGGGLPGTYTTVQFGVPWNFSNTIQLTQVLYNPRLKPALNSLKINQEIVELQSELTVQGVKYEIMNTYFSIQALKKQHEFISESTTRTLKLISNIRKLKEQKLVVSNEEDKLEISKLNLLNQEQTVRNTLEKSKNYLKILIGKTISDSINIPNDELIQRTILTDKTSESTIELQIIEAQKRLNLEEKTMFKLAYIPTLTFYSAYNYNYNLLPKHDYAKGINGAFIGVRLDWTLFDGLETHFKANVNKLQSDKLKSYSINAKNQLKLSIINAEKQVEIQRNSLTIAKEQLTLAEKIATQSQTSISQGVINANDLIKSETDLQQAQTNLIIAYIQLRQSELELLKTTGNIK